MKKYFPISAYKGLQYLPFCFLLFVILYHRFLLVSIFFPIGIYLYLTKNKSVVFLGLGMLFYLFIHQYVPSSQMNIGRVIEKKEHYVIVQHKREKMILYTNSDIFFDDEISFHGMKEKIEGHKGFFSFDYASWAKNKGIYYSCSIDDYTVVKSHYSLRKWIYKCINEISNEKKKAFMKQMIFSIGNEEFEGIFERLGFSYLGIMQILNYILSFFLEEKKRKKILMYLCLFFCLFYHFPLLLMYRLCRQIQQVYFKEKEYWYILQFLLMLVYGNEILQAGFLLVFFLSYLSRIQDKYDKRSLFFILQTIFFHECNFITLFFYRFIMSIRGIFFFYALSLFFLPGILLETIFSFCLFLEKIMNLCTLYGSFFGVGTCILLPIMHVIHKNKYASIYRFLILFFFQYFSIAHPLAEVSFINVGQGDAMVIRQPFNQYTVLIDTGKASQYRYLNSFLKAKGMKKIDTLFISHHDEDHDGNIMNLYQEYQIGKYIDEHKEVHECGTYVFYDVNPIKNEDKNQSSLVLYTEIRGLKYLFMGDADREAEEKIIQKYNVPCDILKLGHHGSNTSSSERFLDEIQPKLGIISSGAYSIYKHPSIEVIRRLEQRNIPYYDTKVVGDISIYSFFRFHFLITSRFDIILFMG